MGIGENIRQLRESHGMTQSDFGRIAGVSDKAVSTWESEVAFPRIGAIERISQYFKIPKSMLLGDAEDRQMVRMLEYYEQFKTLINVVNQLDDVDRARLEERALMMLESEKYHENH